MCNVQCVYCKVKCFENKSGNTRRSFSFREQFFFSFHKIKTKFNYSIKCCCHLHNFTKMSSSITTIILDDIIFTD